ncbi:MAG: B12-binding domain-containing radical SAM protein [Desulfobacterales bacterium]|nr:B12-binding domain-containing radical SAM protein [Desulfobacterales bacterium]
MKIQDTRKNILLINPKNGTNILQDYNYVLPFLARKFVASPLPLLTVASLIPERHHVRLVDLNVQEFSEKDLSWGDLAFITGIELHREEIRKVVKLCKKANLFVVVGGLCATRSHSDIEAVDTFVLGEAEDILGRFFEDYESGRPQHLYQSETYPDLSKSPIPRYDLVDMKNYVNHILQYSRGCCNKCEFCQLTGIYGNKQRSKPVKNFIKELDALYDTGYRGSVMLGDDNFHINGRIKKLLRAIKNWQISHNYPFSLYVQTDISIASKAETMTLMVDAGFDGIQIGIESPSVSSLNSVNKIVNTKFDLVAAARKIHAHGLEIYAAMMVGMDGDPDDIFEMQYEFLMKAGIAQAMISLLDVSSGTTLYEKFKKQGRVLDEFKGFNTGRYHLNYLPKMDPGALLSGYLKLVSETFRPEAYFQRCVRFMRDYKKTSKPGHFSIAEGIKFFLRFLVGNGSLDFTKHFIWFLLRVLFTRPGNFVKAAEIGIKGFQFYKMTGQEIKENSHIEISDDDWLHHFNNGSLSKATRPGFPGGDARLPVNNSVSIRASELN